MYNFTANMLDIANHAFSQLKAKILQQTSYTNKIITKCDRSIGNLSKFKFTVML